MRKKKSINYGSYDELHEGIYRSKRDKDPWYPSELDSPSREFQYHQFPLDRFELTNGMEQLELTQQDRLNVGIDRYYDDKIVPGPNANKRYVKTKYGIEFYPEFIERNIKQRLYNTLAKKHAPHLVSYDQFMRMSIDEIDSMYDPTKRHYGAWDTRHIAQEKEWERRRRLWEKDARKNGRWWTDFAKKQINDAYANSLVDYDKNMLAMTIRAKSNHPLNNLPENKIEQARLLQTMPVDHDNKRIEAKESFKSKKKAQKKSRKQRRKKLTDYDSGTTFFGWLKNKKFVIGPQKIGFVDKTPTRNNKKKRC